MKYRNVGNAGIKVSEIALGSWLTYGGSEGLETTRKCVKTAVDHGVNYLDLADVYSGGDAERTVGKVIKDLGLNRQHLVIASKVYWPMSDDVNDRGLSRKHIMESIDGTLERLGVDYLDFYFCHRYDANTPVEEVVRAMDDLVHQGKILYWGTSVWNAAQLEDAVGTAKLVNAYRPQVEQPRYNMLDRHIEPAIMPKAAEHGMGIVVFSPLAQGLLTGKYNEGIPEDSRAATTDWLKNDLTEENVVFHLLGRPQETRHIVMRNEQATISPNWSIHSGTGTSNYTFIWAMAGENQEFTDMDAVAMDELK